MIKFITVGTKFCDLCGNQDDVLKDVNSNLWRIVVTRAATGLDVCNECRWKGVETRAPRG